jgi:hypothetical protein
MVRHSKDAWGLHLKGCGENVVKEIYDRVMRWKCDVLFIQRGITQFY